MKRPGVSVVEVIVAVGIAAIVIAAIGNLIGATHRLTTASGKEIQAAAYAREWIEIMSSKMNDFFGCSCVTSGQPFSGTCVAPTCSRADISGSQLCTYRVDSGFDSCWTTQAVNISSADLKLVFTGGAWQLQDATPSHDQPSAGFTRTMSIENISPSETNKKKITVTVEWQNGAITRQTELSTILTAWKDF